MMVGSSWKDWYKKFAIRILIGSIGMELSV